MDRRRTDWPIWAMIAVAALGLLLHSCQPAARGAEPATQPTTQPAECFTLRSDDAGQFIFTPILPGRVPCGGGRYWTCDPEDPCSYDDYRPAGYWSGRICVRSDGQRIELSGWREQYRDWQVISFHLSQGPDGTYAEYTVRTPVGMPDATHTLDDRHTALLLLRNPELAWMLGEVLYAVGATYDVGPFARAQLAGTLAVTPEVAERARVLIDLSDSPSWRNRAKAECALEAMGIDGAKALLLLDRRGLPPQTQLTIDRVLSRWPVLATGGVQREQAKW